MPVKHDLYQDLNISKDAAAKLEGQNGHFLGLVNKYKAADDAVVEAETNNAIGVSDDTLLDLKAKRLKIKDQIADYVHQAEKGLSN